MGEKLKARFRKATAWCRENKDILIVLVPAGVTLTVGLTKLGGKAIDAYKMKNYQDKKIYDRSLGHYWDLKRALTNDECLWIEKRRKNGERLSDILEEMKVLK